MQILRALKQNCIDIPESIFICNSFMIIKTNLEKNEKVNTIIIL